MAKDKEGGKKEKDLGSRQGFVEFNVETNRVDGKQGNAQIGSNMGISGEQCVKVDWVVKDEDNASGKRKRTSSLTMMNWIKNVAKDPCNPAIGSLPDRNKWKNYGTELTWKQILLAREMIVSEKNADASSQQSVWQKRQKMNPSMYEAASEKQRCSKRIQSAKDSALNPPEQVGSGSSSSDSQSSDPEDGETDLNADIRTLFGKRKKRVRVAPRFQAEVPEFPGAVYETDSKWLGTQIWPLDKGEQLRSLIERDPIGKGRQESCGCQLRASPDCVRFHIREKRMKVKLELGSAFYKWKFDYMGEDVAFSWTKEEENKFENVVKTNCLSADKYFWAELFKVFPEKGREALVSYYFNVFLLRRRIHQNRYNAENIDSDDDESEYTPLANRFGQKAANSPGSIFCSPKKSKSNRK